MKISIIIPTYNSEKTIVSCLESIVYQTCQEFEVLIVDGLSTDATIHLIKEYQNTYSFIKYVSEPDQGIYDAMNKGLALAKGEWLYFLGSDDTLYENTTLEKISSAIKSTHCKILYGNVLLIGNAGWAKDGQIYDGYFSKHKIILKNICHQSIFYHREVFETIGLYNTAYKICGDHDFNIRASAKFKYQFVNIIVAKFYGGGKSSINDEFFVQNFDEIIIKHHVKTLHLININNRNLLKSAHSSFMRNQKALSLYLVLLCLYKVTFLKVLSKLRTLI